MAIDAVGIEKLPGSNEEKRENECVHRLGYSIIAWSL